MIGFKLDDNRSFRTKKTVAFMLKRPCLGKKIDIVLGSTGKMLVTHRAIITLLTKKWFLKQKK